MVPMCNSSGVQQGWAIAVATCDGVVSLEYFDVDGASEGVSLPAGWIPCIQGEPGPEWSPVHTDIPYAASVNVDFQSSEYLSIDDVTGNLEFTGSNYTAAREITIRVVETGGASRVLTFVSAWEFVGAKPTTIGANKTALLILRCFGNTAASVVADWEVEA